MINKLGYFQKEDDDELETLNPKYVGRVASSVTLYLCKDCAKEAPAEKIQHKGGKQGLTYFMCKKCVKTNRLCGRDVFFNLILPELQK